VTVVKFIRSITLTFSIRCSISGVDAVAVEVATCKEYENKLPVGTVDDWARVSPEVPRAPHQRSAVEYALAAVDVAAVPRCHTDMPPLYKRFRNIIGFADAIVSVAYRFPET
jgi:hypothetical protein